MTSRPDRIALTGATGVLGRALQREWTGVEWLPFRGDIRDRDAVRDWIAASAPFDALFHFAAIVPTARVEADPAEAVAVNVGGTINVLEALRPVILSEEGPGGRERRTSTDQNHGEMFHAPSQTPWLCVLSTSHVYPSSNTPIAESATPNPLSLYGLTKLQSEQWALASGLDVCIARLFSYSDPAQPASYFIPATIARIEAAPPGGTLEVRGATDTRDFLTTSDIASALATLRTQHATGIFNVASGEGVRVADVIARLTQLLGRDDLTLQPLPNDPPTHLVADIGKLRALGWTPASGWQELLADVTRHR
jgi:nucleoside-diphosphate-sugar epimerase